MRPGWISLAGLAACGRLHFDPAPVPDDAIAGSPHAQTLTIATTGDDGDINNAAFYADGEGAGRTNYAGFWSSTSQPVYAFFRFQLAEAIPAGAVLTANTRLRLWGADDFNVGANAVEFTSVTAELASSTTPPTDTAAAPLGESVFSDSLGASWFVQGSNANIAIPQTTTVQSGTVAMRVDIAVNGGYLTLTSSYQTMQVSDFEGISFDINVGGTSSASVDAIELTTLGSISPSATISSYVAGGHFDPNTWYHVVVPASAFRTTADHFDFRDATNDQVSFFLDNIRLEKPAPSYRMTTLAMAEWPNAGATSYVNGAWNTSPSLAAVLQELVDAFGGLSQGSYVTLWVTGPNKGFGYTNETTYMPGYADSSADPMHAAQLTIEYQ